MRADALLLSVCPATGFGEALLVFDGPRAGDMDRLAGEGVSCRFPAPPDPNAGELESELEPAVTDAAAALVAGVKLLKLPPLLLMLLGLLLLVLVVVVEVDEVTAG
jgi:hypothetical protein